METRQIARGMQAYLEATDPTAYIIGDRQATLPEKIQDEAVIAALQLRHLLRYDKGKDGGGAVFQAFAALTDRQQEQKLRAYARDPAELHSGKMPPLDGEVLEG